MLKFRIAVRVHSLPYAVEYRRWFFWRTLSRHESFEKAQSAMSRMQKAAEHAGKVLARG